MGVSLNRALWEGSPEEAIWTEILARREQPSGLGSSRDRGPELKLPLSFSSDSKTSVAVVQRLREAVLGGEGEEAGRHQIVLDFVGHGKESSFYFKQGVIWSDLYL